VSTLNWRKKYVFFVLLVAIYLFKFEILSAYTYKDSVQHIGDLIVSDGEIMVINNTEHLQYGDVIIKENGNLTIVNSSFCMAKENRTYVTLSDNAVLNVMNSELTSQVHVLHFRCYNSSRIIFKDIFFSFWGSTVIELWGNSTASFEDSRQKEWVQLEVHDVAKVTVKDSTIAMIQCSGSSVAFFQNSNIMHGSSCTQYATLILKHSNFKEWLTVEGSSDFIAIENSTLEILWPHDSSNVTINNSYVNTIEPFDSPKILLANGSRVDNFEIDLPLGYSIIHGLREGYMENYTIFEEERIWPSISVYKSSVRSFDLNIGSSSNLFLEDSSISRLSLSKYGSATIYNSEVHLVYCDSDSLVILWNSRTSLPIQSQPGAIVRYFSTVSLDLFYVLMAIAIILALALTCAVLTFLLYKKSKKTATS